MLRRGLGSVSRRLTAVGANRRVVPPVPHSRFVEPAVAPSVGVRCFGSEFLTGSNNAYLEEMYEAWRADPATVHKSWDVYFRTGQSAHVPNSTSGVVTHVDVVGSGGGGVGEADFRVLSLLRAYRSRGHECAKLNPLMDPPEEAQRLLDIENFGFTEADLAMPIRNLAAMGLMEDARLLQMADSDSSTGNSDGVTTLGELVAFLKKTYTGEAAYEFSHINDPVKSTWLKERIERVPDAIPREAKVNMVNNLAYADRFEKFLAKRHGTVKRFGIEGLEALIPGLNTVVDEAATMGIKNVVLGMAHRGRLNVLTNVMMKPLELVFKEFKDVFEMPEDWSGTGDVKYHLGTSGDYVQQGTDNIVHLTLLPNPSHLEAVNTVVLGKAKAKMDHLADETGDRVLPILLHGDAAMAGQGIVYETMQLAKLPNFQTGGTLHVVTNNQVGFTTNPSDSRSTRHPSDIAKAFSAPVFHVNADNVFEVCRIFKMATDYRQEFRTDVVINLLGYRRYGHNEMDEPAFTQPTLYKLIREHPPVMDSTVANLVASGEFEQAELDDILAKVEARTTEAADKADDFVSPDSLWLAGKWIGMKSPAAMTEKQTTGVSTEVLQHISDALCDVPKEIGMHRAVATAMKKKKQCLDAQQNLDWATCEALAFGSLMLEDIDIRISGQDSQRGTFGNRLCVLHDQATDNQYTPLRHLQGLPDSEGVTKPPGSFTPVNSPLSEYGVLGFELGYSLEDPYRLVLWEAQFGDFVNGSQIIIDQFISAMENKWYRQSGLVMLLPHGYQGLGPEHSSCRIERFLQNSCEDEEVIVDVDKQLQQCNWQICNATTPANYFHLLRRQIYREFRKPLIIATPKSLLRHKLAVSSFDDLSGETSFLRVIPEAHEEEIVSSEEVQRLVFCSGRLYYDLLQERREKKHDKVALVRVEQLSPFPSDLVAEELAKYSNAECMWAQEEPRNMGAWGHVAPRIATAAAKINGKPVQPRYHGREPMASTAEGSSHRHEVVQNDIIEKTFVL